MAKDNRFSNVITAGAALVAMRTAYAEGDKETGVALLKRFIELLPGISHQDEFAVAMNVSTRQLARWLTGESVIEARHLEAMGKLANPHILSLGSLLAGNPDVRPVVQVISSLELAEFGLQELLFVLSRAQGLVLSPELVKALLEARK